MGYCYVEVIAIIASVTMCAAQGWERCNMQASSDDNAQVAVSECGMFFPDNVSRLRVLSVTSQWSIIANDPSRLALNITMTTAGEGTAQLTVISSEMIFTFFCGRLIRRCNSTQERQTTTVIVSCLQSELSLDRSYMMVVEPLVQSSKRNAGIGMNIPLPGCLSWRFKDTTLCKVEDEKRIRFHVRRESTKPVIRVVLSRSAYKSRVYDVRRSRARYYYVTIKEQSTQSTWLQRAIETKELRYPKHTTRFTNLTRGKTYAITVWRRGELRRYTKRIQLC